MDALAYRESGGVVMLRGMRCKACKTLFFPAQHFGCEACGADENNLVTDWFSSHGKLHTFTTVHVHPDRSRPYSIGEVTTAASQRIRARLLHSHPVIGDAVTGRIDREEGRAHFVFVAREHEDSR